MNRYLINVCLFFLLTSMQIFGQFKTTITLDWQSDNKYSIGEQIYKIPYFSNASFLYDTENKQIRFEQNFKIEALPI